MLSLILAAFLMVLGLECILGEDIPVFKRDPEFGIDIIKNPLFLKDIQYSDLSVNKMLGLTLLMVLMGVTLAKLVGVFLGTVFEVLCLLIEVILLTILLLPIKGWKWLFQMSLMYIVVPLLDYLAEKRHKSLRKFKKTGETISTAKYKECEVEERVIRHDTNRPYNYHRV